MLFMGAVSHPHEVSYVVGIINPVFYIFYECVAAVIGFVFLCVACYLFLCMEMFLDVML